MNSIRNALDAVNIGEPTPSLNLTMHPLLTSGFREAKYIVLADALESGRASVTEISESGSVPKLAFHNKSDKPVLLLDGEQLVGCKQNRILNLSM